MKLSKWMLDRKPWEIWNVSRKKFDEFYGVLLARDKIAPKVGDPAPHFEAERLDANGNRTGAQFKFAGQEARPVAFVFGSYT
ncbi:MAG: hypothetical protein CBD27_11745 [Rhodospirillaceae bacterium TMED167]|nr:hypothetical protein [Rhodospirillaceae bacterium]OUW24052.1 MAG: hypothetical protein CBD27_11745 [Rhodospirillaceae bacterium TMED167]